MDTPTRRRGIATARSSVVVSGILLTCAAVLAIPTAYAIAPPLDEPPAVSLEVDGKRIVERRPFNACWPTRGEDGPSTCIDSLFSPPHPVLRVRQLETARFEISYREKPDTLTLEVSRILGSGRKSQLKPLFSVRLPPSLNPKWTLKVPEGQLVLALSADWEHYSTFRGERTREPKAGTWLFGIDAVGGAQELPRTGVPLGVPVMPIVLSVVGLGLLLVLRSKIGRMSQNDRAH